MESYGQQQQRAPPEGDGSAFYAVEVLSVDSGASLGQLRTLCSQAGPVLQLIAALGAGDPQSPGEGLALVVYGSARDAETAVQLLNGCPLGGSYLQCRPAETLPGALVDLLYSLQPVRGACFGPGRAVEGVHAPPLAALHRSRARHRWALDRWSRIRPP